MYRQPQTNPESAPVTDFDIAEHYNTLGQQLYEQGNFTGAINAYGEALKLNPNSAETYSYLGLALEQFATPVEAIVAYKMALQLDPTLEDAQQNLQRLLSENPHLDESPREERRATEPTPLKQKIAIDSEPVLLSSQTAPSASKAVSNQSRSSSREPNLVAAGLFLAAVSAMGTGAYLISIGNASGGGVFGAGGTMMGACVTMVSSGRSRKNESE